MYNYHIHFYLTGHPCSVFEFIEGMPSLENFSHEFVKSIIPDSALAEKADVIFANVQGIDAAETVRNLAAACKKEHELILLADKDQIDLLAEYMADIWAMPMSEAEAKFRVLKWQQAYRDTVHKCSQKDELLRRNNTLESIFKELYCGMLCHTLDGSRIISVNKAAISVLGYDSLEEMEAEGFQKAAMSVPEADRGKIWNAISSLKKEGDSVSMEYRMMQKGGKIKHILENIKLMSDNGEPFFQRVFLDATDQKLKEKENAQHQMEMLQALSTDFDYVCFFDLETGKGYPIRNNYAPDPNLDIDESYVNEFTLEGGMEFYTEQVVYEEDRPMFREKASPERLAKELQDKSIYYVKYRTMNENGMMYYQLKAVRVGDQEGKFGILMGFRSVDDETREELKNKKILEDALAQANRASKAKSAFLSNMSHDIRTPMNAIVGFTTLAITHIEKKDLVKEYLKKIMISSNHLLSLINDILDMSRIESGKIHLEEVPCSLPEILHGLRNILVTEIHAKQLELYIDTVDVVNEDIYCDKLRLNQVLLNLLSNAVKYTEAGGLINLRIREKHGAPAGSANYEFYIRDTGIGMSQEFVERIFEPFERERNSTISKIQGTGLGMAITKNIVDMMNGDIAVKSEQGKGTEITVSFTFRLHSEEKEQIEIPEIKDYRALVVDDDFNTCDSASYMLQQVGMRAEWTLSGKEAVLRTRQAVMRGDSYFVYIIDWMLPDMNGIEVTRRIRKEVGENVPVIILTAYDWTDIEEEAREAGVTAFCSKPLFLSELRKCLYAIVNAEEEVSEKKIHMGRLLLVEDNELNQEIALMVLTEAGFTVDVAENGQAAVDKVSKSAPGYYQLILMDVQMPVMNGYDATTRIRGLEDKALSSIPILAMTADAFEEDKRIALNCGMNGHIAKPINIEELLHTLEEMLAE